MIRPSFVGSVAGSTRIIGGRSCRGVLRALPQPHDVISSLSTVSALPTMLTSVKVFDGSEITDAVVVSNSYWSTLATKLPYLLLAQLLATISFVVIASFVASQGKFLVDQVVLDTNDAKRNNSQFRRADEFPPPPDLAKLLLCICIDILGSANEAIPLVGELVDVVYAPIAALLLRQLFAGSNIVFLLEFTEEILPFTDVLPLATICWVIESFFGGSRLANALRIGEYASKRVGASDAIDVGANDADTRLLPQPKKGEKDNSMR